MNKVIWILTSGEYSDYSVHAAYNTKEEAEAARDALNAAEEYTGCEVEEIPLSPDLPSFKDGFSWWSVSYRDGTWRAVSTTYPSNLKNDGGVRKYSPTIGYAYGVTLVADTEERALKAGMERIMQFIAQNG